MRMSHRNAIARIALLLAVAAGLWWWQEHRAAPVPVRPDTAPAVVEVRREVRVAPSEGTTRYRLRMTRIPDFPGQRVLSETWNIPPTDSGDDSSGAWVGWEVPHPDSARVFTHVARVEVLNAGLSALPRSTAPYPDPASFLAPDSFRHSDDSLIRAFAAPLRLPDTLATLRAVWNAVLSRLAPEPFRIGDLGSREALSRGSGDCTEYADLFAATCRALGIPARRMSGWASGSRPARHAWVEAWIPSRGWTAFDPRWGEDGSATFEHLPTRRVAVSWMVSGAALSGRDFFELRWWGAPPVFSSPDTILSVSADTAGRRR